MSIIESIDKLFSTYDDGYEPPEWTKKPSITLMKQCKVFYNKKDKISDIKRLVKEREPVNIAMNRYYNQTELNKHFKFKKGYYGTCPPSKNSVSPPNFIVYTPTQVKTNKKNYKKIHILNAIGLAFDSKKQRDYKDYMKLSKKYLGQSEKHKYSCANFYKNLFTLIFEIAIYLKKKNIVMSLVGANNFAILWHGGPIQFKREIWFPVFKFVRDMYPSIKVMFMGTNNDGDLGYFPDILEHPKIKMKLNSVLFVNAWDCWSIPGNGNTMDHSLDGFIGRHTQIGVNGTSLTNPYLEYIKL